MTNLSDTFIYMYTFQCDATTIIRITFVGDFITIVFYKHFILLYTNAVHKFPLYGTIKVLLYCMMYYYLNFASAVPASKGLLVGLLVFFLLILPLIAVAVFCGHRHRAHLKKLWRESAAKRYR